MIDDRWSFIPDVFLHTVGTCSAQGWLAQQMEQVGVARDTLLRKDQTQAYAVRVPGRGIDLTVRQRPATDGSAQTWWALRGFTLHVPDPAQPSHPGWSGAWPAGLPSPIQTTGLPELEAVFGPPEMAAGMLAYFVVPAPGTDGDQTAEDDAWQWTVQCVLDRTSQTLRSLSVMGVGEAIAASILAPWNSAQAQRKTSGAVQCASNEIVPRTGVWELSLPATHPSARHLHAHPQRFVHRQQGDTMRSAGLLQPEDELYAIWTWLKD